MKTFLITIAALSILLANAAFAASTSNSEGDVRVFNPNQGVLFENPALDYEPTGPVEDVSLKEIFFSARHAKGQSVVLR